MMSFFDVKSRFISEFKHLKVGCPKLAARITRCGQNG